MRARRRLRPPSGAPPGAGPTRRIGYYNAARANAGAVRAAVRMWNRSGTRLRFVRRSRRRAGVEIRYWPSPGCVPGGVTATSYDRTRGRAVRASRAHLTSGSAQRGVHPLGAHPGDRPRARARPRPRPRDAPLRPDEPHAREPLASGLPAAPAPWQLALPGARARRRARRRPHLRRPCQAARRGRSATCSPRPPRRVRSRRRRTALGGLAISFVRPATRTPAAARAGGAGQLRGGLPPRQPAPRRPRRARPRSRARGPCPTAACRPRRCARPFPGRVCVAVWARDGVGRFSPSSRRPTVVDLP